MFQAPLLETRKPLDERASNHGSTTLWHLWYQLNGKYVDPMLVCNGFSHSGLARGSDEGSTDLYWSCTSAYATYQVGIREMRMCNANQGRDV